MFFENLYGLHPVRLAIEGGRRKMRQLLAYDNYKNPEVKALIEYATERGVPVQYTTKYELNRMVPDCTHQNVILQCEPLQLGETNNLPLNDRLILGLEGITDPHNLGSIIRTCAFFSIPVILDRQCGLLSPVVSKSSAGALELFYSQNKLFKTSSFNSLKHNRTMIASVCSAGNANLKSLTDNLKYLLVMGNEGSGLKKSTLEKCTLLAHIPGHFPSLNVSVATGILLNSLLHPKINI